MRNPNVIDLQWEAGSANLRPYELRFYPTYSSTTLVTVKFLADLFSPEGESTSRLCHIPLIKGAAVQHNPPRNNLRRVTCLGLFLTREDFELFMRWFLSNAPYADDPYPTEYLELQRDFAELVTPDGEVLRVSASGKPSVLSKAASQGRLIYEVNMEFYHVDQDEQI